MLREAQGPGTLLVDANLSFIDRISTTTRLGAPTVPPAAVPGLHPAAATAALRGLSRLRPRLSPFPTSAFSEESSID